MQRIAGRFARVEPRCRVQDLVLGLLSYLPRKNCRTIVEHIGDTTPDGRLQHLLGRAKWDADLLRDDLRGYVLEHLADEQAVLVVDETGDRWDSWYRWVPRPARPRLPRRHHGPRTPRAGPTRRRDQPRRTDLPHL